MDITGVINGLGGSVWGFGDASPRDADGWQVIPIAPGVVQARLDGRSHGFSVMDDVGSEYTRTGNTIEYRPFPIATWPVAKASAAPRRILPCWLEDGAAPAPAVARPSRKRAVAPVKLPPLAGTLATEAEARGRVP